jgi:hypothetical protein
MTLTRARRPVRARSAHRDRQDRRIVITGIAIVITSIAMVIGRRRQPRATFGSEIIASVDGPRDVDWDATWLAELDRRTEAAKAHGETSSDWTDARARILKPLGRA